MRKPYRILLTGGGSGGHIIPNLAIAEALRAMDRRNMINHVPTENGTQRLEFLYLGSRRPLDRTLVESARLPFRALFSGKWRRYFDWRNFVDPFLALIGFFQAFYYVLRFWPHVIFTKGGFVSLPVALAAFILRRPLVLHESDAVMGLANRLTARLAKKICIAFPLLAAAFNHHSKKIVLTGNPVRSFILQGQKEKGVALTGFNPHKPVVLVWGGSQGAQEINDLVARHFEALKNHFQIVHVTGSSSPLIAPDPAYKSFVYLNEELPHIYAITDFVVSRAGANSLAELTLVQKSNILLPLAGSARDHQNRNAEYFENHGASLILRDKNTFPQLLFSLWQNKEQQESMRKALTALAMPDAARKIADLILSM